MAYHGTRLIITGFKNTTYYLTSAIDQTSHCIFISTQYNSNPCFFNHGDAVADPRFPV